MQLHDAAQICMMVDYARGGGGGGDSEEALHGEHGFERLSSLFACGIDLFAANINS